MIISQFKREDGFGVGIEYNRVPYDYGKISECVRNACDKPTTTITLDPTKTKSAPEPPMKPSRIYVWLLKPNAYKTKLDTFLDIFNKNLPKKPNATPRVKPKPKSSDKYLYKYC